MSDLFKSMCAAAAIALAAPVVAPAEEPCCGTDKSTVQPAVAEGEVRPADHAYAIGDTVQDFTLQSATEDKGASLSSLAGDHGVALIFWNQQCPFVQEATPRIAEFQNAYKDKGIPVVAIDAGTNNAKGVVKSYAAQQSFPILLNPDSQIAARFGATRTPEVFLLDKDLKIRYHGAFDNGKLQGENATRQSYLQDAANALIAGQEIAQSKTKAFGCSLKYAPGVKALPRAGEPAEPARPARMFRGERRQQDNALRVKPI